MNKLYFLLLLGLLGACKNGESIFSKNKNDRPSPPAMSQGNIEDVNIKIDYSSPRVRGRKIWGELVPYNRLWRTGANEATTITISSAIQIDGKVLPKGKYALFTIPKENSWTVIFNSEWDLWGSYDYSEDKNALVLETDKLVLTKSVENMTFTIEEDAIVFNWELNGFKLITSSPKK